MRAYGGHDSDRLNNVKRLIREDIKFYGKVSITLSRRLVKREGMTYPAIASISESIKKELNL